MLIQAQPKANLGIKLMVLNLSYPVSGHTKFKVLYDSMQMEFSKRQSDRQEIDLLGCL